MKKSLIMYIVVLLLIVGIFTLTGCTKNNNGDNGKSKGVDLTLDFKHMNKKVYYAHVNTSTNDKVAEFNKSEPNFVRIENEKENYVLDITLDTEAKDAYEQLKNSAKEGNEIYEEVKYGKYKGYYSSDDGIYGYILLDSSDSTFNVFVMFSLYLNDENKEDSDIEKIYKSSSVQDILNTVKYESKNK